MSADPGSIRADGHQRLPNLAAQDAAADPHIITRPARTERVIELRIHTSIAPFDVAAEEWFPAVAGFAVTIVVHTIDPATGRPRHLPPAEPAEWARAIFSTLDAAQGYFLGAVDPETGSHRRRQLAYRLYLDTDRQAIPVPRQVVTCPHYLRSAIDGRAEITIPTTARPRQDARLDLRSGRAHDEEDHLPSPPFRGVASPDCPASGRGRAIRRGRDRELARSARAS